MLLGRKVLVEPFYASTSQAVSLPLPCAIRSSAADAPLASQSVGAGGDALQMVGTQDVTMVLVFVCMHVCVCVRVRVCVCVCVHAMNKK